MKQSGEEFTGAVEKKYKKNCVKTILVMDDDEIMRTVMRFMLERAGYEVHLAEHGDEAIEFYRDALRRGSPFDAVILDWNIRGGKGAGETIRILIEIDPAAKAIVTSCDLEESAMTDFRGYGFRGALTKPFSSDDLEQILYTVVNPGAHP
jgi:two-component system cell cycle sensor histidine kinase/response regulator CckA